MIARLIIGFLIVSGIPGLVYGQNRPFPQALDYEDCIKPDNVTQKEMNASVTDFYEYWKSAYLRESNGRTPGGWYVYSHPDDPDKKSVSEAHGYGMILMALMAGFDDSAKVYFDGMFAVYNDHRSTIDSDLMSWIISPDEDPAEDEDSATDGDMDIAYALLLADNQWGSTGAINYLDEARRIITDGIKQSNTNNSRLMLGDWWVYDTKWAWASRSSDWMTDHLQAYYRFTNDISWLNLADSVFSLINENSTNYSPSTGLMPDFVDQYPVQPVPPWFLESEYDGQYNWNACRFPWRMAVDFAHFGTVNAKNALDKILVWIKADTENHPANIKPGYLLSGEPIPDRDYTSNAFTAPIIAACIVNQAHQQYLNDGWALIKDVKEAYYADTINLLCMLLISGNWWNPEVDTSSIADRGNQDIQAAPAMLYQNYPNPFGEVRPSGAGSLTVIRYRLAVPAFVNLEIYNSLGQKVRQLVNLMQMAGEYRINFEGSGLSGGIYYYRLRIGQKALVRKMFLLR